MKERIFAFIVKNGQEYVNAAIEQINQLKNYNVECSQMIAFSQNDIKGFPVQIVNLPQDTSQNDVVARNFINDYFKQLQFKGFLHVVSGNIIFKDMINEYLNQLEYTMDFLDYSVHFSTVTDPCNYVYSVYNPRMQLHLDDSKYDKFNLPESLIFTSHSNTAYVTYDFSKIPDDLLHFNEQFSIPMFHIIEFLARRRNTKSVNQLYYMNMYLTVPLEKEAIKNNPKLPEIDIPQEKFKVEDALFKSMNIEFKPDNNIDMILEDIKKLLESKTQNV